MTERILNILLIIFFQVREARLHLKCQSLFRSSANLTGNNDNYHHQKFFFIHTIALFAFGYVDNILYYF